MSDSIDIWSTIASYCGEEIKNFSHLLQNSQEGYLENIKRMIRSSFEDERSNLLLSEEERIERASNLANNLFNFILSTISSDNFTSRYRALENKHHNYKTLQSELELGFNKKRLKHLRLFDLYEKILLESKNQRKTINELLTNELKSMEQQLQRYQCDQHDKKVFSAVICELLISKRSEGHLLTQALLESGINLQISHAPASVTDYMSGRGLSCSFKTAEKVLDYVDDLYLEFEEKYLISTKPNPNLIAINELDNYNHITWRKYNNSHSDFTRNVPSISVIYKFFETSALSLPIPDLFTFNINSVIELVIHGFKLPSWMNDIYDINYRSQSIYNFHIHPSIPGRSSCYKDIQVKILDGFLIDKMDAKNKPVFTLVDPEIQSIIFLCMFLEPTKYPGIQFLPPPFHQREHLIFNFFCDPTFSLLFFLPCLYECFRLQQKKRQKQHQDTLRKVLHYIDLHSNSNFTRETQVLQKQRLQRRNLDAIEDELSSTMSGLEENDNETEDLEESSDFQNVNDADGDTEDESDDSEGKVTGVLVPDNMLNRVLGFMKQYIEMGGRENDVPYSTLQSNKMNFARLLYIFQLIHVAYQETKQELQTICAETRSWCCYLLFDLLENGISKLCIEPFQSLVLQGKGHSILELTPTFVNIMGYYNREKVVRGTVGTLITLCWWQQNQDFLQFYLKNCCRGNELFVELLHSLYSRQLPSNTEITTDMIRQQASHVMIRRGFLKRKISKGDHAGQPHEILNGKTDFEGEVIEEELKHEIKDSQKQLDLLKQWLIVHFKRIGSITKDQSIQKSDFTRTSIDDLVTRGKQKNIHSILPKYNSYLLKKKSHYQTNHYLFLDKVDKQVLIQFLTAQNVQDKTLIGSSALKTNIMEYLSRVYAERKIQLLFDLKAHLTTHNST